MCHFPLVSNILPLALVFVILISVSQWVPPWVCPAWGSLRFLDLVDGVLSHVREVFFRFSQDLFSQVLSLSLSFWDMYSAIVGTFNVVPEVS